MIWMRVGWYLAMAAVTVLALMPIEHLQLPVFDWWDKAQHALAFVVLTVWALLLWPLHDRPDVDLGSIDANGFEVAVQR